MVSFDWALQLMQENNVENLKELSVSLALTTPIFFKRSYGRSLHGGKEAIGAIDID